MATFTTSRKLAEKLARKDKILMEYNDTLERVLTAEDLRIKCDKELLNNYNYKKEGYEKGIKRGIKRGIERGIKEGLEKGMENGIDIGAETNTRNIIITMISRGYKLKEIAECVGKPIDYINSLCTIDSSDSMGK